MAPYQANIIGVVLVDAQKVLLDVVGSVEQLEANVTVERLVIPVDVLVSVVQVSAVSSIRAARTDVALIYSWSGRCCSQPCTPRRLGQIFQVLQQPHDFIEQRLVTPQ